MYGRLIGAGTISTKGAASRKHQYRSEEISWKGPSLGPSPRASSASPWALRSLSIIAKCATDSALTTAGMGSVCAVVASPHEPPPSAPLDEIKQVMEKETGGSFGQIWRRPKPRQADRTEPERPQARFQVEKLLVVKAGAAP
jgi:hypothetical protein